MIAVTDAYDLGAGWAFHAAAMSLARARANAEFSRAIGHVGSDTGRSFLADCSAGLQLTLSRRPSPDLHLSDG